MFLARKLQHGGGGEISITSTNHPDLVVMYTMDNITGSTLVDESPNGNDGTIFGATTATGVIGNALSYDGANDYSEEASSPSGSEGAICLWTNRPSSSTTVRVWSAANSTQSSRVMQCRINTDGTISFTINLPNFDSMVCTTSGSISVDANAFHFIVVQSTGSAIEIYIDGVSQTISNSGTKGNDGSWFDYISPDQPINLGRYYDPAASQILYTASKQDLYRRFSRSITQQEIDLLYNGVAGA